MKPRLALLVPGALVLLPLALAGQGATGKAPVPAPAALAKGEALIRTLFREDYAKARADPAAARALATTLLREGRRTTEDVTLRYAALRQAHELAARAGDAATALEAAADLARGYSVDGLALKADALVQAVKVPQGADAARFLTEQALAVSVEALAAERFETARQLLDSVRPLAGKNGLLAARLGRQTKQVAERAADFERVRPALEALSKDPRDPTARLAVGKFRCLVQGKWDEGLPLLANCGDAHWAGLAKRELAKPSSIAGQLALADGWWDTARGEVGAARHALLQRAYRWYERAFPELEGAARARVRERLIDAVEEVPHLIIGEIRRMEASGRPVAAVAIAPDGRFVYWAGWDHKVRRAETRTGRAAGRYDGHTEEVWAVAVSSDGRRVLSGGKDHTVRLWDADSGRQLLILEGHTDQVRAVAFSPDGRWGASAGEDRSVRLWDLQTGREAHSFNGHGRSVESVAFSPDGKYLLSAGWDRTLRLWDVAGRKEVRRFTGHTAGVYRAAFSADGRLAVSAGGDQTVRLWDVASGKELRRFAGHTGHVIAVAFAADGQRVVSGGGEDDPTIRLWDAETGEPLHRFGGHREGIWGLAFAPDGRRVVSCSEDGTVRLWGLPR
jgi:WD40 repeat protein